MLAGDMLQMLCYRCCFTAAAVLLLLLLCCCLLVMLLAGVDGCCAIWFSGGKTRWTWCSWLHLGPGLEQRVVCTQSQTNMLVVSDNNQSPDHASWELIRFHNMSGEDQEIILDPSLSRGYGIIVLLSKAHGHG